MKKSILALTLASVTLFGCGGGSGDGHTPTLDPTDTSASEPVDTPASDPIKSKSISGKVIDGYVTGATVYLDLNNNGKLDPGEPSSITVEDGNYSLALTDKELKCSKYVPTVVFVPVGAEDSSEGTVEEAYTMSLISGEISDTVELNITPFTTMLVETVHRNNPSLASLTCGGVVPEQVTSNLNRAMNDASAQLVKNYNIPAERLYADYVAEGDSETHEFAVAVVAAFKKGHVERVMLQNEGNDVLAHYYTKESELMGKSGWSLYSVYSKDQTLTSIQTMFDDNFENGYIFQENVTAVSFSNQGYKPSMSYRYRDVDHGELSATCTITESRSPTQNKSVVGTFFERYTETVDVDSIDACRAMQSNNEYTNERITLGTGTHDSSIMLTMTTANLTKYSDYPITDRDNLFADIESIPVDWTRDVPSVDIALSGWSRTKIENINGNRVETNRGKGLDIRRTTTYPNGTWLKECAISPYTNDEYSVEACNP